MKPYDPGDHSPSDDELESLEIEDLRREIRFLNNTLVTQQRIISDYREQVNRLLDEHENG